MSKHCQVLLDTPEGVLQCELELPDEATIAVALEAARMRLGDAAADWQRAVTGIYGRIYPRTHVPVEGDRIELYRALKIDPRAARRARAAAASSSRRGRGNRL
jgi:putative ubiquitin-RnfH superfamily antitoxin RatB of RatAB toxin-antitoxin module